MQMKVSNFKPNKSKYVELDTDWDDAPVPKQPLELSNTEGYVSQYFLLPIGLLSFLLSLSIRMSACIHVK